MSPLFALRTTVELKIGWRATRVDEKFLRENSLGFAWRKRGTSDKISLEIP